MVIKYNFININRLLLTILLVSVVPLVQGDAAVKPQILILTTGGTIASRTNAPLIDGPALVQAVPELLDHATVQVEEFSVIGSSKMTPDHWLRMANRINEHFSKNENLTGIVITHGTDTLEETAYFLNLTVKAHRPVILVGSMRSSNEVSADGSANLLNAVRVSVDRQAQSQGVLVVLNESITAARDVWKTDNRRVQTFSGGNVGHIGSVDPDGVHFYHRVSHPHTKNSEFYIANLNALPRVLILSDFTGMDAEVVEHFATQPMGGLVIRTFAGGRMSAGMIKGLRKIADRNIPIVITSRVPNGRIVSPPRYDFSHVIANGQQDNKARILLMLALQQTSELTEIQRIFDTY